MSLLSVFTALNTLIGRANIAVPTTFDQVSVVVVLCVVVVGCLVRCNCVLSPRVVVVRLSTENTLDSEK